MPAPQSSRRRPRWRRSPRRSSASSPMPRRSRRSMAAPRARARPLLVELCRRVEHCGPVGAGATMKLAINLPLMISWQAFGEAFALCRDLGVEPQQLLGLFTDISATTNALKARAPMVAAMMGGGDPGGATFTVDSGVKDLRTMLAEGEARGIELPL